MGSKRREILTKGEHARAGAVIARRQPHANDKVGKVRGSVSPRYGHLEPGQAQSNDDLGVEIVAVSLLHVNTEQWQEI